MLGLLLDAAYLLFLIAVSPWLIYRRYSQKKSIAGLAVKLTGNLRRQHPDNPCLWFHAVSVGEVLQLRAVISRMRSDYPGFEFVITTTTRTGFEVAKSNYPDCAVQFFPFDFSWAVRRAMKSLRPKLIVLVELELWPNVLLTARRLEIPVAIINGRISDASFRMYRHFAWLTRPLLETCSLIAAQNSVSAKRFLDLGAPPARVFVTGNIKFDGVETHRSHPRTEELRRSFGIATGDLVFVAGSTQAPEEEYALTAWETLRDNFPSLKLLIVPRHKERFEEVADLIAQRGHTVVRRSTTAQSGQTGSQHMAADNPQSSIFLSHPVFLLDTLGELSKAWGLADVAFVGGSLTNRGGQNMIEPAGYGAAVLFGPNTWNFQEVAQALLSREAAVVIHNAAQMTVEIGRLLGDDAARERLGAAAQAFVLSQQGAVERTVALLGRILPTRYRGECRGQRAA
jgi:3-deoxy-D-manno-octulosonic-acid transferase